MSNDGSTQFAGRVLVVDDHAAARRSVADVLRYAGFEVEDCASAVEGLKRVAARPVDVVVTDLQMPGMNGLEFIRELERRRVGVQCLMVTAHASVSTAVEAMRLGAFDYLEKPFDATSLEDSVKRAVTRAKFGDGCGAADGVATKTPLMIGESAAMRQLRAMVSRVAASDETVLICGESGVGKELVAQLLHAQSSRHDQPLVSLNCPVLSEQLTESELFGHRRGAFTGADADRIGRFELAQHGAILLDEITEINLQLQAKLLRVLQERTFERVGCSESIRVDVRVIATTNRDLRREVSEGRFREDLYYRLAVVPLQVPPLREREGDVPLLIDHMLEQASDRLGRRCRLTASALGMLEEYHWPGNVRELHNLVARACVLSPTECIEADLIRSWLWDGAGSPESSTGGEERDACEGLSLAEAERRLILDTLKRFDGHRAKTAESLGIGVRTLSGKLRDYGVAPRQKDLAAAS